MSQLFKIWIRRIIGLFFLYSLGLLFLLIGGQGVTQSIPFSGIYLLLFLLRFIPQSLLYVIPIALFCSFATVAYQNMLQGNLIWFEYLFLFKKSWYQKIMYTMLIMGFLYGYALGWGIPALERSLYHAYSKQGLDYLFQLKTKKLHAVQNSLFLYLDEKEGETIKNFFCNLIFGDAYDLIFSAQEAFIQHDRCEIEGFEGMLVHKNHQVIRMQVERCSIDLHVGLTVLLDQKIQTYSLHRLCKEISSNKKALVELCKRLFALLFCLSMPLFGWKRGKLLAEQRKSFPFLLWNGLLMLLIFYFLLTGFSLFVCI